MKCEAKPVECKVNMFLENNVFVYKHAINTHLTVGLLGFLKLSLKGFCCIL